MDYNTSSNWIDVIIPAYNCEATIQKTVSSIRSCGLTDYSILIVDDGSSDGTANICRQLTGVYPNIRYIRQENAGVSAARNCGIRNSNGRYLLFVDSDDELCPFDPADLKMLCENTPDVLIFGMTFQFYHKGILEREEVYQMKVSQMLEPEMLSSCFSELYHKNYFSSSCNKFIKRSVLTDNDIRFDQRLINYEDLAFSLHVLSKCKKIAISSRPNYLYKIDSNQDHTSLRISRINNLAGNTDLIGEKFLELEQAISADGAPVIPLRSCLLSVYLELFSVKVKTLSLSQLPGLCASYFNSHYFLSSGSHISGLSVNSQKLYRNIIQKKCFRIWIRSRYLILRHAVAKPVKRILKRI